MPRNERLVLVVPTSSYFRVWHLDASIKKTEDTSVERYTVALSTAILFLTGLAAQDSPSGVMPVARPDARRLSIGHFEYRDSYHGRNVGAGTITIRKAPGSATTYDFSSEATFSREFSGFSSQRWECVTTSMLEPISATLSFGDGKDNPPVFDLKYRSGRVTGFAVSRKASDAGAKRLVDAALTADTFDQRIDWATVLASDLTAGQQFRFNVYDPSTGVSRVEAQVGPPERVQVPAGSFDAYRVIYRVAKSSETEKFELLASRDAPRMLIREDFQNGVVTELVAVRR
jgi:hypothetical protein